MGETIDVVFSAIGTAERLFNGGVIDHLEYSALVDGLDYIPTLKENDEILEDLWALFSDVPMDPETECMEEEFCGFPEGTHREAIWHWFDERHSKGAHYLLYEYGK